MKVGSGGRGAPCWPGWRGRGLGVDSSSLGAVPGVGGSLGKTGDFLFFETLHIEMRKCQAEVFAGCKNHRVCCRQSCEPCPGASPSSGAAEASAGKVPSPRVRREGGGTSQRGARW